MRRRDSPASYRVRCRAPDLDHHFLVNLGEREPLTLCFFNDRDGIEASFNLYPVLHVIVLPSPASTSRICAVPMGRPADHARAYLKFGIYVQENWAAERLRGQIYRADQS